MNEKSRITWLRVGYRVGAVADALAAAAMLSQAFLGTRSPLITAVPEPAYRYAMGMAGSLMLGWTILLLWADRRPVERRGILAITIVVVLGLMGCSLYAVSAGLAPWSRMIPMLAFLAGLIALFSAGLWKSRA